MGGIIWTKDRGKGENVRKEVNGMLTNISISQD